MLAGLWGVLKWVWSVSKAVMVWAGAHPVVAVAAGIAGVVAGDWLADQPWAGAQLVGGLLGRFGGLLTTFGLGAWFGKATLKAKILQKGIWKGMPQAWLDVPSWLAVG